MSESVTFRSATPVSAPTETTSTQPSGPTQRMTAKDDDATPYVYGEVENKPYAVKFLDLKLYYDDGDFPEVREQSKALDAYVIKQAKARGLSDSHDSYKEVVEALYKQIGKSPNEDPVKALKRLSTAAGAIERLESAKLKPVLSASTMEPEEIEDIQK